MEFVCLTWHAASCGESDGENLSRECHPSGPFLVPRFLLPGPRPPPNPPHPRVVLLWPAGRLPLSARLLSRRYSPHPKPQTEQARTVQLPALVPFSPPARQRRQPEGQRRGAARSRWQAKVSSHAAFGGVI